MEQTRRETSKSSSRSNDSEKLSKLTKEVNTLSNEYRNLKKKTLTRQGIETDLNAASESTTKLDQFRKEIKTKEQKIVNLKLSQTAKKWGARESES